MMRPLSAAAAAVLFGVGVPTAHAQCGCARPSAGVAVRGTSPGVKTAVPAPTVKSAVPTTAHHVVSSVPAAGCASCVTATSGGSVVVAPGVTSVATPVLTTTPAGASCPLCAAGPGGHVHATLDDKPRGEEKPAARAEKEVTLTGTMVCAKCGLKEPGVKKCTNALQVKDGDMTVTYFLDDKGNGEAYHEGLCGGGTKAGAKVTGTTSEKDGKRWVKATKVEEKK